MRRRTFLASSLTGFTGTIMMPAIIPACTLRKGSPNTKINIAQIGCGRIARTHDLPDTLKYDIARVVACSDVDIRRARECKQLIEQWYATNKGQEHYIDVAVYRDYREMLEDDSIDAVIISTPDHWHAKPAIDAAKAGKDIYLQKPASLTIREGRTMADVIRQTGRIFQIGSQQRSANPWPQFKRACELVRNGRIGDITEVHVGLPGDPAGEEEPEMPVPENLDYDFWLGSTPEVYYTEKRVHPQHDYSRPGWLRCEQFGAGMITGWGAHHIDTAHWGMGTEFTGPVGVEAEAEFPASGLWDVHGDFHVEAKYANGAVMYISGENPNGVKFVGTEGWIFVARGDYSVTASDPVSQAGNQKVLDASDPAILESEIGENEVHLYHSEDQHGNWLDCIISREDPVAPAEVAHRSCSACLVSHIAMKLPRKLYWDPDREEFIDDEEANAMLSRPQRAPYGTET
jgi:myo-inositol 2-dehydrogenase/D-chiro-inositol 1-dehydrogenase